MSVYELINNSEYVSFDIFDTLIKRNVQKPTDVFSLVQEFYSNKKTMLNFRLYRIYAEKIVRKKSKKDEVTLDEIYELLRKKYGNNVDELKELELELERKLCRSNRDVYKIYDYARKNNKKIIIISDMYLNKETIENILHNNGIDKYYKIYLSSDIGLTKYKGTLFDYVVKDLKCDSSSIVHIGDNSVSDISQASKRGWKTYKIESKNINLNINKNNKLKKEDIIKLNIINSFIEHNVNEFKSNYYKVGYSVLGILFYGMLQWINTYAVENNIDELVFLARDGYILKKAYDDIIYSNNKRMDKYMYASRRTLIVPSFDEKLTFEKMMDILGLTKKDTIKSFFLRVGLDPQDYKKEIKEAGFTVDDNIGITYDIKNMKKLFDSIKLNIINNAEIEREKMKKYIQQLQLENKKIALIDIGWRGSMQYSLQEILKNLKIEIDITGLYLGLSRASKKFRDNNEMKAESYLFDYNKNNDLEFAVFSFIGLLETFFVAPHGTTLGYTHDKKYKIITPLLDELEYDEENFEIIQQVQKGALDFIKEFSEYNSCLNLKINERVAFNNIMNLGTNPSKRELDMFSNISFSDFGKGYLARTDQFINYIKNPKKLFYDFFASCWKVGFLKKVFKINLPYFKIYKIMKK